LNRQLRIAMGEAAPQEFRPSVISFTLGPLIHDEIANVIRQCPSYDRSRSYQTPRVMGVRDFAGPALRTANRKGEVIRGQKWLQCDATPGNGAYIPSYG
jgi:hypothetical protein